MLGIRKHINIQSKSNKIMIYLQEVCDEVVPSQRYMPPLLILQATILM